MNKLLVPVDFPISSPVVVEQAIYLAQHFRAEINLLHVVSPWKYPAGLLQRGNELRAGSLDAEAVIQAQQALDQALIQEFNGMVVKRVLRKGDPGREISQLARDEGVDLVVLSARHHGFVYRLLLGSVAAKVLHDCECPVWINPYLPSKPASKFAIRSVLCSVDLSPHSRQTLLRADKFASAFSAKLTLVHVTGGAETYGPGGSHVVQEWKDALVNNAAEELAKLQQDLGTKAELIIESGHLHQSLKRAATLCNADVMVIGRLPSGGHLGDNGDGYAIIRDSPVPVLSL